MKFFHFLLEIKLFTTKYSPLVNSVNMYISFNHFIQYSIFGTIQKKNNIRVELIYESEFLD